MRSPCRMMRTSHLAPTPKPRIGCRKSEAQIIWSCARRATLWSKQQAVTRENSANAIGGLTFSDPPTQAELEALSSACETVAAEVRAISSLIHSLQAAGVTLGIWAGA